MATTTLTLIRDRCRQKADAEGDTDWVDDTEINQYINDSYRELYGILARYGLLRNETIQTITGDGSATYALPSDYMFTIAVFRDDSNDCFPRLRRSTARVRPFGQGTQTGDATEYRTARLGTFASAVNSLELYPVPAGGTYYHSYVPLPDVLSADGDTLETGLGWDEYIVVDVAIKMGNKENNDVSALEMKKAELRSRIEAEAEAQDMSETLTVADVRSHKLKDPADNWWYRNGD